LKVWLLAKLKWWRKSSYRWSVEQKNIDQWLNYIKAAMDRDADVALEVAELARLIKGYGSTHRRGTENFNNIVANLVVPYLDGKRTSAGLAVLIRSALEAALADPDGWQLGKILTSEGRKFDTAAE
jgi:indolepyruvate ferredoxin oxidoreductase beta subunit